MSSWKNQDQFIINCIENYNIDTDKLKSMKDILSQLSHIFSHKNIDIKYLLSGTDILLRHTCKTKDRGLYTYSKKINTWLTNKSKFDIQSVEGFIYTYKILDTNFEVIVKRPKKKKFISTCIREFYIGYTILNNLRYYIPTFVYTLGSYWKNYHDIVLPHIIYEKVNGINIKSISFTEWLKIFTQLLLTLEIAQKHCRFTHFDLHTNNIILKKLDKNIDYTVYINNNSYRIHNTDLLPVIIDFGLSSVYHNGKSVGKTTLSGYGIFPYIIPGYDMYKFLCYSVKNLKHIQNDLLPLFNFYKSNDPYNIATKKLDGIKSATNEYCKMVSYSKAGTYTPLLFFKWIYEQYPIIHQIITISPRKIYMPINKKPSNSYFLPKIYKDTDDILSYISIKYIEKIYNTYSYKGVALEKIKNHLYYSEKLIEIDKIRLEKVFLLEYPKSCLKNAENIFSVFPPNEIPINIEKILYFVDKMNCFLDIYYTILELKLQSIFSEWITKFTKSSIYKLYVKNIDYIDRVIRWYYSLTGKNTII